MGRVLFSAKAEPAKAGPAINWSEIESRLQEISAPARPSELPPGASLPSAPLAYDPAFADELPVTKDQPVSIPGDPLDMHPRGRQRRFAAASSRHPHGIPGRNRGIHFIE